jgi:hypothetical protein
MRRGACVRAWQTMGIAWVMGACICMVIGAMRWVGRAGHVCGRERNYQGMCTHVRARRARGGAQIGGGGTGTGTGTGGSNGSICWAMSVRKLLHNKQENRKKKTVADTSTEVSVASTLSATRLPLPFTFFFFFAFYTKQIVFALGPEPGLVWCTRPTRSTKQKHARTSVASPHPTRHRL